MDKKEIILASALIAYAAVRIYQKYFRKDQKAQGKNKAGGHDSFSPAKDDDYEPYSGK
jgi:hypothetical protein